MITIPPVVARSACAVLLGIVCLINRSAGAQVPATQGANLLPAGDPGRLEIPPASDGLPRSGDFTVKVRKAGTAWQEVAAYHVKICRDVDHVRTEQDTTIASFDFSGETQIAVTSLRGPATAVRIRPLAQGIVPQVEGNTITFNVSQPMSLSVETNGDIFHNLHLLMNAPETARPDPADPRVTYFGPGVHTINTLRPASGTTVYLAAGAVVRGNFRLSDVENVQILGRGILQSPRGGAFRVERSRGIRLEGLIVAPSGATVFLGNCEDVTIANLKSFSAGQWNDGIDVYCSRDVRIDGVFMRNSDDCIAIYAHRWNFDGDVRNITVRNSTLWADVAHPINVGTHGNTPRPETIENLHFMNLDILDQKESQQDYQGCMAINAGDDNLVRNVTFENIRVEDFREGQLVNLRVMFNRKYNTSPGRGIENVLFKDIRYNGTRANTSIITGYDATRAIKNVVFENLRINGLLITDNMPQKPSWFKTGDVAGMFIGEHVEGVVFRAGP